MEIKITDSPPLSVSRSKILEEFTKELKYRGIDDRLACLWLDPIYTGRTPYESFAAEGRPWNDAFNRSKLNGWNF